MNGHARTNGNQFDNGLLLVYMVVLGYATRVPSKRKNKGNKMGDSHSQVDAYIKFIEFAIIAIRESCATTAATAAAAATSETCFLPPISCHDVMLCGWVSK